MHGAPSGGASQSVAAVVLLLAALCVVVPARPASAEERDLKNVPVQDYEPIPMLEAGGTVVFRAKYPAVDVFLGFRGR